MSIGTLPNGKQGFVFDWGPDRPISESTDCLPVPWVPLMQPVGHSIRNKRVLGGGRTRSGCGIVLGPKRIKAGVASQ